MTKYCILALLLAAQSEGAVVRQVTSHSESNLRVQSNSTFTFSQKLWNNAITSLMVNEIEMTKKDPPKVNKAAYVVFAMMFGVCGCDRCFMGQICLGTCKGLTLGGFLIWHLVDYFVALVCALTKAKELHMVGYSAVFEEKSIDLAFYLSIVFLVLQAIQQFNNAQNIKAQRELQQQQMDALMASIPKQDDGSQAASDIPKRHQSLAYMPTALTKGLRKAGLVTEKPTVPELIACFDKIDKNGDGQLDHDEIKEGLAAMGASDEAIDEMIKTADKDGDGKISKDEFLINMMQQQKD